MQSKNGKMGKHLIRDSRVHEKYVSPQAKHAAGKGILAAGSSSSYLSGRHMKIFRSLDAIGSAGWGRADSIRYPIHPFELLDQLCLCLCPPEDDGLAPSSLGTARKPPNPLPTMTLSLALWPHCGPNCVLPL